MATSSIQSLYYSVNCTLAHLWVDHDSPRWHVGTIGLKLRFHQKDEFGSVTRERDDVGH
jgi:hypothetical protein